MPSITDIIGGVLADARQARGIDPLVFGMIYFGSIPFFMASMAWLVRNISSKKPPLLPAILTIIFWTAAYLFLNAAGTSIPAWVYLSVAGVVAIALGIAWAAMNHNLPKRTRRKLPRR
ncbi:MAG: hypothetical protein HGB01_06105 [Chlorobiaceae bacterium]|nr:hypothetical protein [Chlorobiales bacterium]NTU92027.1 hypothetical protein [Chlorobiaceae bacterium]NTV25766.1 hypothetical protein [Chlorobiaceae bacterium]